MADNGNMYDAYIVYSHRDDALIARALERSLSRFGKSWYQSRRARIFRDPTTLAMTHELWPLLEQALDASRWLIVLASPDVARSSSADHEIKRFLQHRGPQSILIVLTAGSLRWDSSAGGFSADSDALPPSLMGVFPEEPRWLDLRWVVDELDVDPRNARFVDAIAALSAPLHGLSKDELIGEEISQHRQTMQLARAAVATLVVLTMVAIASAAVAFQAQRNAAAAIVVAILAATGLVVAFLSMIASSRRRTVSTTAKEPEQEVESKDSEIRSVIVSRVADEVIATLSRPFRQLLHRPVDVYIGPTSEAEQERTAQLAVYISNLGRTRAYRGRLRVVVDSRLASDTHNLKDSYKQAARARHFIFVCTPQTLQSPAANFILQEWLREHSPQNAMAVIASQEVDTDEFIRLLEDSAPTDLTATDLPESRNIFDLQSYYNANYESVADKTEGMVLLLSQILHVEPYWIRSGNNPSLVRTARKRSHIEEPLLPWNISETLDFVGRARAAVQLPEVTAAAGAMGIGRLRLLTEVITAQETLVAKYLVPFARRELLKAERNAEREVSIRLGRRRDFLGTRGVVLLLALAPTLLAAAFFAKLLSGIFGAESNKIALGAAAVLAIAIGSMALRVGSRYDLELSRQRAVNRRYARSQPALLEELGRHLQDDIILPHLRLFLNTKLSSGGERIRRIYDSTAVTTRMKDRFRLQTAALRKVYGRVQTPGGASIGLAGPRGAGKTSILESLCRTRYADHPGESGSQFGVVIPAPIEYQSEPFAAQILASVCREVLSIDAHRSAVGPYSYATNLLRHRRIYSLIAAIAALASLLVINNQLRGIPHQVQTVVLIWLCGVATVSALLPSAYMRHILDILLYSRPSDGPPIARSTRRRRRDISRVAQDILKWLFYKEEQSRVVGSTAAGPLGISLTTNRTLKLEGKPWSTPELVYQFRYLVKLITSSGYRVLIGVDELDKINDDEQAIRLLNDIKAFFGVEDCYFIVSVSMSAVVKFEQRGLPFQEAFESALDEVVRVEPLSTVETLELLQKRLIGIPYTYAVLSHIVAGGLPRDVIRAVRELFDSEVRTSPAVVERKFIVDQIRVMVKAAETRCEITNSPPTEQLKLIKSLISGPVDEEAWTNALVTALVDIEAADVDSLRAVLYTFWALTVYAFINTFGELDAGPTKQQLSLSDTLAHVRLRLSHDLAGAVESLNFVRKELGSSQLTIAK